MNRNVVLNRRILNEFEPLLHRVMQDAFVEQDHLFYDDYLQELRLQLLKLVDNFRGNVLGESRYRFIAYAKKGLYWYLLDLQRKEWRQCQRLVAQEEKLRDIRVEPYETSQLNLRVFDQKVRELLSKKELGLYNLLLDGQYSIQEIADYLGCSRQTIYNQKMAIRRKLTPIKNLLME